MVFKVIYPQTIQRSQTETITEFYQADTPGHENEQARA